MQCNPSSFFRLRFRPWDLLAAGGAVVCAATGLGFFGRFSWMLDLFSHFRVQYLITLTLLGILLFAVRHRKTAIVFLGFASLNLLLVLPLYFGGERASREGAPVLRAMLLNVNTHLGDADHVKQAIVEADPDILVLEEINSQWIVDLAWLTNSHPHSLAQPREDNFGIGLFSKLPLVESEIATIGSAGVPSILATVDTGGTKLRIMATHPPPPAGPRYSRWRNEQLERLPDLVRSSLPVLLLGDLNVTPWSYHFRRLLQRAGLRNSLQGYGVQPSWPSQNLLLRIPIDHCLHSPAIQIVDRRIGPNVSSDHYPVILDFVIVRDTRGGR